ncbi:putative protein phosphatase 2C 8 [Cucumis melo var. makuwa]|uniref:protein-serine/threonine phosphatase n=1 Tax=Cucumis melo var. makuwa TaxID=1194695 RepID=A0A5D3BU09_CUCMM|nr:putative protein phosphatase 2C 8 [Cucumis melo var. makuwa]
MCDPTTMIKTKNTRRRRRLRVRKLRYKWQRNVHAIEESDSNELGHNGPSESNSDPLVLSENESISALDCGVYSEMSIIGRRKEMEDEVRVELGLTAINDEKYNFFAVYDGHGGAQVAQVCRERLHQIVAEEIVGWGEMDEAEWGKLMEKCFERMDDEVNRGAAAMKTVGSAVVAAVIGNEEVVVANCGDCRAVLGRDGIALPLSDDHKPGRTDELKRIESAGGRVINWNGYRVLGVLATSRSIGDEYLKPFVISKPEVTVTKRTDNDEFLILGSDGLWDVVSNEIACNIVRRCFGGKLKRLSLKVENDSHVAEAAAVLAELAVARGSKDNISHYQNLKASCFRVDLFNSTLLQARRGFILSVDRVYSSQSGYVPTGVSRSTKREMDFTKRINFSMFEL